MNLSKGRHLPGVVEVIVDGETVRMTPENYEKLRSDRLQKKTTAKGPYKSKEKEPVDGLDGGKVEDET